VITTPHNQALTHQSISLIDGVRRRFPHAKIVVSLHSRRRKLDYIIAAHAKEHEIEVIDAAGELSIFDRYASYDLHVGHRLHGHIGFLRQRIPSVLVMEDARSRGFSRSIPIGCFSAFRSVVGNNIAAQLPRAVVSEQMHPDPEVISRISEFLDEEISTSFLRYVGVAPYIDGVFCEVTLPEQKRKVKLAREAIDLMPR
jgi:hypothetical protein